ncbi:hypothetical protein V1460_25745 [Streptomyces sp. SCSIO 30461]|uniref:hypothetical protein n=1 Tax=Streptomyces sp. SCSIO 30461 TaxID=3118085 RepID=UPI0030D1E26C
MAIVPPDSGTSLVMAWHRLLAGDPGGTAELAEAIEKRMSVQSWRHPDCPVPVRPLLLPRAEAARITGVATAVVGLAVEECARRASSPAALAEALGSPLSPLVTDRASWNRWSASQARPDLVLSGGVPKVLELNIGSAIGGPELVARMDAVLWSMPPVRAREAEWKLRCGRTIQARRELLVSMARDRCAGAPRIAIAGWSAENFRETVADAEEHGAPCSFVELEELSEDGGLRDGQGRRVDILLQKFLAAGAYLDGEPMEALEQAVARDSTLIASPELSTLQSNKKVLAWLTERGPEMPPAQRNVIEQHVPWTADLVDGPVRRHGRRHDLLDLLLRDRDSFVLKPADAFGGNGVVIGREVLAREWEEAVRAGAGKGWVAQEYCRPDHHPVSAFDPASGEVPLLERPHVISPLLISGAGTGFLTRFARPGGDGVTSAQAGATNTVWVHD